MTGSMIPLIHPGDIVFAHPEQATAMRVGDVVTFADPGIRGRSITHRVIALSAAPAGDRQLIAVTTKGDNNPAPEHWVIPRSGQVGALVGIVPGGRTVRGLLAAGWIRASLTTLAMIAALAAIASWGFPGAFAGLRRRR
jgi:signal peptidase I